MDQHNVLARLKQDLEPTGLIHVMGPREKSDVQVARGEFTCSRETPFNSDLYPSAKVIFHTASYSVGEAWVCGACGEGSG
jgi:hypothetical protein